MRHLLPLFRRAHNPKVRGLSINDNGDVVYKFKKAWSDGTTPIKLTPMEMMERLAALVPRPRVHLTRYHGVRGPHYKYRKQIVPKKKSELTLEPNNSDVDADKPKSSERRIAWARLLKRVFNIDVTVCPKCQGNMKIIAAIENPAVIKKNPHSLGANHHSTSARPSSRTTSIKPR